jgi:hypothetical protein
VITRQSGSRAIQIAAGVASRSAVTSSARARACSSLSRSRTSVRARSSAARFCSVTSNETPMMRSASPSAA